MRKLFISALAITALLCGCRDSRTCAPIGAVTRVVVHDFTERTAKPADRVITNPAQIRELIDFANAHRKVSRPSLYNLPAPQITAAFYNQNNFVGELGAGPAFLFVSCPDWKGIRAASDKEIGDFEQLVRETN